MFSAFLLPLGTKRTIQSSIPANGVELEAPDSKVGSRKASSSAPQSINLKTRYINSVSSVLLTPGELPRGDPASFLSSQHRTALGWVQQRCKLAPPRKGGGVHCCVSEDPRGTEGKERNIMKNL